MLGGIGLSAQSHIVIPSLADASAPSALNFEGGECDVLSAGETMECQFQQVFLTIAPLDAQTCLITTNRYERTFHMEDGVRWVSREGPSGECGVVDVITLQQEPAHPPGAQSDLGRSTRTPPR